MSGTNMDSAAEPEIYITTVVRRFSKHGANSTKPHANTTTEEITQVFTAAEVKPFQ